MYHSIDVKGDSAGHTRCPPLVSLADNTEQENINNRNKKLRATPVVSPDLMRWPVGVSLVASTGQLLKEEFMSFV